MAPKPWSTHLRCGRESRDFPVNLCRKDKTIASSTILPWLRSCWVSSICWWITGWPQETKIIFFWAKTWEKVIVKTLHILDHFTKTMLYLSQVSERTYPTKITQNLASLRAGWLEIRKTIKLCVWSQHVWNHLSISRRIRYANTQYCQETGRIFPEECDKLIKSSCVLQFSVCACIESFCLLLSRRGI